MTGALPRVHLVTPAIVERTVARYGMTGILTPRERATVDGFPVERRRRDWLAGRIAAKRALRAALHERGESVPAYRAIDIWNGPDGAPRFTIDHKPQVSRQLNISIAHANGTGLAAVANTIRSGTVGVDIEPTTPISPALIARILVASELARLTGERDVPTPLALWTAKEAVMKAAHAVCTALRQVELSWTDSRSFTARIEGAPANAIFVRHRTVGDHTIAIALCR